MRALRPHALGDQAVGDLIGTAVELGEGDALPLEMDGDPIGRARELWRVISATERMSARLSASGMTTLPNSFFTSLPRHARVCHSVIICKQFLTRLEAQLPFAAGQKTSALVTGPRLAR